MWLRVIKIIDGLSIKIIDGNSSVLCRDEVPVAFFCSAAIVFLRETVPVQITEHSYWLRGRAVESKVGFATCRFLCGGQSPSQDYRRGNHRDLDSPRPESRTSMPGRLTACLPWRTCAYGATEPLSA